MILPTNLPLELSKFIEKLNNTLDSEKIETIKDSDMKELSKFHFGLGSYIRNLIFTDKEINLVKYFEKEEITHPDSMSRIIIQIYYRILNNIDINIDEFINDDNRDLIWRMDKDPKERNNHEK